MTIFTKIAVLLMAVSLLAGCAIQQAVLDKQAQDKQAAADASNAKPVTEKTHKDQLQNPNTTATS